MIKYLVLISLIAASACATTGQIKDLFPPKNYVIQCPYTGLPTIIPKGFFNNPDNWITEEDFNRIGLDEVRLELFPKR